MRKGICVLGSTGSIGRQTLAVASRFARELRVVGLAAQANVDRLFEQVQQFEPVAVSVWDSAAAGLMRRRLKESGRDVPVLEGQEGMQTLAALPEAETVVVGVGGMAALGATLSAARTGKRIALATKEVLAAAGGLIMREVQQCGASLIPVDSEHSAVFQCLQGQPRQALRRLILTASGGPFRGWTRERLAGVTPAQAVRHPNWRMGPKVSVDSATMMNKGIEVMEASWLFGLRLDQIDLVIHPESIVHALVEFTDGAVMAQLGVPDMRLPIQYALFYPERKEAIVDRLSLEKVGKLSFEPLDVREYPCLQLALAAGQTGGTMPAVLNAANEEAVGLFLAGRVGFVEIQQVVAGVMGMHRALSQPSLEDIVAVDRWAREQVTGGGRWCS